MTLALVLGVAAGLLLGIAVPLALRRRAAAPAPMDPATVPPAPEPPAARTIRAPRPAPNRATERTITDFRGVTIRSGPGCCDAVKAVTATRYLAAEAPPLPVAGCDRKHCTCSYQRTADRRTEDERRFGTGQFGGFGNGRKDHRTGGDRRRD